MLRAARVSAHVIPATVAADDGPAVLYELQGHVAVLTLNRAANRNAMSVEMLNAVRAAGERAASDPEVRCVLLTARGRNFCGGADFSQAKKAESFPLPDPKITSGDQVGGEASFSMYSRFLSLLDIPVPVVGALQGHAIGGGMGLALCCDIRVCHASSQYGSNFVKLGIHPGMATTYVLPRLVGVPRAMELLLTGRLVDGREAEKIGLATDVGETPEEVVAKAFAVAQQIAANAPVAVRWTKRSIYRHLDWKMKEAAWDEAALQTYTFNSADFKEGSRALLEKRKPTFTGK